MGSLAEPWQESVRGGLVNPAILNLSGLDQIRAWERGLVPRPPIARLTGLRMEGAAEGSSSWSMPASAWMVTPQGAIAIGMLAVLADPALGCAVQTILPPGTPYTTAELSLTMVRPVPGSGDLLHAHGRVVHPGRRMALSAVSIEDRAGRLVAHGTSRCMILPRLYHLPPADSLEQEPPGPGDDDADDPWRRPDVQGASLAQELWDAETGLEIMCRLLTGELPRPPLCMLTGLRVTNVGYGSCEFTLPATGWLASPTGLVEGGMIAMLADAALQSAIATTAPPGCAVASVDLKVNFLRPCPTDGRLLLGKGSVVHQGKSLVIANGEVLNADGKRVAIGTGSALLLPGTPATLDPEGDYLRPASAP
ncbi:MAG TPA: PaaI family thioesterase [Actinomycetota bacterium]|nr:PaaI family thioesterase [Actinomycetota bacterium]